MAVTRKSRRRASAMALFAIAVGVTGLAACGDDDGSTAATTTTVTLGAPSTTVTVDTTGGDVTSTTAAEPTVLATTTTEAGTTVTTAPGRAPVPDDGHDAFVASMRRSLDDGTFEDDDLDCIADGIVTEVADRWSSAGVTPEEIASGNPFEGLGIDDDDAARLYGIMDGCVDDLYGTLISLFSPGPDQRACIERAVPPETIRKLFIDTFRGETADELLDIAQCLP